MTKLTKAVYVKSTELLNKELEAVKAVLALALETDGANFPNRDMWNQYHDRQEDIENALYALEDKWLCRDWTSQDWIQWDLITQNID